jgi:hypothetical protein
VGSGFDLTRNTAIEKMATTAVEIADASHGLIMCL